jgi:hypothetical protein
MESASWSFLVSIIYSPEYVAARRRTCLRCDMIDLDTKVNTTVARVGRTCKHVEWR